VFGKGKKRACSFDGAIGQKREENAIVGEVSETRQEGFEVLVNGGNGLSQEGK